MKKPALALLLALGLLAASAPPRLTAAPAPSAEFAHFVDDYFEAQFRARPSAGTEAGLHQYDQQLEDLSRARVLARIAELKQLEARLDAFDRSQLSFDEAIDAQALGGDVRSELQGLEVLRTWERNPMPYVRVPGNAVDGLMKRNFAPAHDRLRSIVARLEAVPAVYAAARANVQNPPKEFTDLAIRMCDGAAGFFEGAVARWAKDAAGSDTALLAEFEKANAVVLQETRAFAAWLKDDLLPRSKGSYAIGASNFLAKLKYDEMVEMPLETLLARGEAQLAKDHAAFVETARRIDPAKTPAQVMRSLSDEHPTAEDLIPSVRRSLEAARRFLVEKDIVTIPSEVRPLIEETPPFARGGSFASMDNPGPFETKATEAFYYVTPVEKDWDAQHQEQHLRLYNPYVVPMINVHEVWPGHYLQFLYSKHFKTKTRQLTFCGTNAEGWAHYTEQMMVDQGFGDGSPKIRLAQLQEALLRDCRYVCGVKLHTKGMTVEEGARLFVETGFQEPANGFEEARRGAYNPTYLYYTLGKLEIQDLAREYMQAKKASLKQFHDAFVAEGGLPIPLVRKILLR
jgi:uncharacterized protein (DUF885 family)